MAMEFTYRREGSRAFPETIAAVEAAVRAQGLDVVRRHDLQATLASKGFAIQPLIVLDIGAPESTGGLCKMHIYAEGDVVWVSAIRPSALFQEVGADGESADVEASVVALVDAACS